VIVCCWAHGANFNKEREKEWERKKERERQKGRKKEGAPYDKSKGLFLNGFLFLFLLSFAQQTPRSKPCLGSTPTRVLCTN
jgi:hypothetical protein